MCTVTIVPADGGLIRLACNRDEQRTRPTARPPEVQILGERRAVFPVDPTSGGTWIAVSDAGLAMTLLNVNSGKRISTPRLSRGRIIPWLIDAPALDAAIRRTEAISAVDYAPFRLVLTDGREVAELRSDGAGVHLVERQPLVAPLLFTSSGLGDELVEGPRRRVFEGYFEVRNHYARQQDAFHRHQWPDRPHLSVCMSRGDARTVSYTVIERHDAIAVMHYVPDAPDPSARRVSLSLDLETVSVG